MALEEGLVLATGISSSAEVDVFISNQPRFKATAARVGRRLAVSVNAPLAVPRTDNSNPTNTEEEAV